MKEGLSQKQIQHVGEVSQKLQWHLEKKQKKVCVTNYKMVSYTGLQLKSLFYTDLTGNIVQIKHVQQIQTGYVHITFGTYIRRVSLKLSACLCTKINTGSILDTHANRITKRYVHIALKLFSSFYVSLLELWKLRFS